MTDLVTFDSFADALKGVQLRTVLRMADRKKFPPYIRYSPSGPPWFSAAAVQRWVTARNAILEEQSDD